MLPETKRAGKFFSILVLLVGIGSLGVFPVYATTWDLVNDFSYSANPNGVWSYGVDQAGGGAFQPFNPSTDSKYYPNYAEGWIWTPNTNIPNIWKNIFVSPSTDLYGVHPGEVSVQPYTGNEALGVVRWIAPGTGIVNISGSFGAGDSGAMSYYIFLNGVLLVSHTDDPNSEPISITNLSVSLHDKIDFAVGPNSSGSYGSGNTPIHATIEGTLVPLPPTALLLGSGLLGLGLLRFRRKA